MEKYTFYEIQKYNAKIQKIWKMRFTIAIVTPRAFRRYRIMSGGGCATTRNIWSKIANYLVFFHSIKGFLGSGNWCCLPNANSHVYPWGEPISTTLLLRKFLANDTTSECNIARGYTNTTHYILYLRKALGVTNAMVNRIFHIFCISALYFCIS